MKSMKNIKPSYAVKLGKGVFMGVTIYWICSKCGNQIPTTNMNYKPSPTSGGKCKDSKSGNHVWKKMK